MDQDILLGITPTYIFGNSISFYLQGAAEFSAKFFDKLKCLMTWNGSFKVQGYISKSKEP